MAILANRVKKYNKTKTSSFKTINFTRLFPNFIVFIFIAIFFFNSSSSLINSAITDFNGFTYSKVINPTKDFFVNSFAHVINIANFSNLHNENIKLKIENQKLINTLSEAKIVALENKQIKKASNIVSSEENTNLFAKIVYVSTSEEGSIGLIEAGRKNGIKQNQIVLCNGYLAGRIVTVGKNYAKFSLVNSYNSRIPVKTLDTGLKAILVGNVDNGGYLVHLHERQKPFEGELIVTSGDGSFYPKNIPVARVEKVQEGDVKVKSLADPLSTDFVEIIDPHKFDN